MRAGSGGSGSAERQSRLARLAETLGGEGPPLSPERVKEQLDARARALAMRRPHEEEPCARGAEVFEFQLGSERYALETRYVREVLRQVETTVVPGAPPALVGVAPCGGEPLPIVDLRRLFGIAAPPLEGNKAPWIAVIGEARAELGLCIDEAIDVIRLPAFSAPPQGGADPIIRAITSDALVVLDGAALLTDARLFFGGP